jgi:hypothetical protein
MTKNSKKQNKKNQRASRKRGSRSKSYKQNQNRRKNIKDGLNQTKIFINNPVSLI